MVSHPAAFSLCPEASCIYLVSPPANVDTQESGMTGTTEHEPTPPSLNISPTKV